VKTSSALENAIAFLNTSLAAGSVAASQVLSDAQDQGIAERTLRRAKDRLGVHVKRIGQKGKRGGGSFTWQLDVQVVEPMVEAGNLNTALPVSPGGKPSVEASKPAPVKWILPDRNYREPNEPISYM